MKNMRYILLFLLMLTLCGCERVYEDERQIGVVTATHRKMQWEKQQMELFGAGSSIPEKVEHITLYYNKVGETTDREYAKRIYEEAMNDAIALVNSNEKIRPYLAKYPWGPDEVWLSIGFLTPKGVPVSAPYISSVIYAHGQLNYLYYDRVNHPESFNPVEIIKEPYP